MLIRWFAMYLVPIWLTGFIAPCAAAEKLNILHIHSDDLRADGLHSLGTEALLTPNLDHLVQRGVSFARCYTMGSMIGAVCTPSRTMLLTGRSWQRIPGARHALPDADDPETFLPKILERAGYQTWHMGKPGNSFAPGIAAFETNIKDGGDGKAPETNRELASRRLADRSITFLKSRQAFGEKRPFYMYLAPQVPHDPRIAEPQFHSMYSPEKIPLPKAFLPLHPFDNGEMIVRDEKLAPWPRTPEDTRQQLADYYACISCLDHHVGRIFEELRALGQWDNTLVVFSSDNGLSMGEHGLFGKQNLYEFGGMHVPLVIAGPGISHGESRALVYLMDLYPTLADYAGAAVPQGVEGQSLRGILEGRQTRTREWLYTGYRDCMRSIRDDRWKLIRYPLVDRTQLFDLDADPREQNDLSDQPQYAVKVQELMSALDREMNAFGDDNPLHIPNPKPSEWNPPQ
jgi:arylsulfatase A-like enzyme